MNRRHAKSGPFWIIKQVQLTIFWLLGLSVLVVLTSFSSALIAAEGQTVPCQVRLEFSRDEAGGQLVRYRLFLQIKNTRPQPVSTVSVLWLDAQNTIIGNSDADCRANDLPLDVSQTGQCSRTVQTISNRLIQSFGQSIWTEIVNSELKTFDRIKSCKIEGYRYGRG
ncbi:hypothetical protein HIMB100_00015580 [SAR116 cluster alpha proteobacterium HIMB100]|nr:hypothetical protein HIMB100_00015580 [SAR116 cluster alpha proteobacterium HIMB100]